jgi:hypothetical protein
MGGEIINLLHDDNGNNYIYVNPYGYINRKYDDTVEGVILTRLLKSGCFEVIGIAKIGVAGQLVYPRGNTKKEKLDSTGNQLKKYEEKFDIKYDGIRLSNIYKGSLSGSITFKSEKLLLPKKELYITDKMNKDLKTGNLTYNLPDKRFPNQSLISYIDNKENPKAYDQIKSIINNTSIWDYERKNTVSSNKVIDKHFNFLNIIKKEDDELVYSNMFYYFFSKYPKLIKDFAKSILNVSLSSNIGIEREKNNIDLFIEDDDNIIVIENKIKSGINGVFPRHDFSKKGKIQSQLYKYYKYAESIKKEKMTYYFIFIPVYNRVDLSLYEGSKLYKKIDYAKLYNFFKNQSINDPYYKDFVNSLYKHTKDRAFDYYEDMEYRFIQKLKQTRK